MDDTIFMKNNSKLKIYQGIIQYLLESTHYTLKNIAELSNSSIKNIRSIYCDGIMPPNFMSELILVKIYQVVLAINMNKTSCLQCCLRQDNCYKTDFNYNIPME